jgi:hypothetical protein
MKVKKEVLHREIINVTNRRRALLPWWIKSFIWVFLIFGAIAPFALIFGIMGSNFQVALYGLQTNHPLSLKGLFLITLFLFKGVVAYGLWTEKNWAIYLGIIDAAIGIATSLFMMLIYPLIGDTAQFVLNIRLELIALIPYLLKMKKIEKTWALCD